VAQVSAAATLWDYGVHPVGVFGPQRKPDGTPESVLGDVDLDAVESVGEAFEEFNVEALAALRPDLIVTVTYEETLEEDTADVYWYVPDESLEEIQAVAPILAIGIAAEPLDTVLARFAELAEALGADLESTEIAAEKARFDTASTRLTAATKAKPDLSTTFVSGTPQGLFVVHPEASADVWMFTNLGLQVVTPNAPVEEFWEQLSWENAGSHPADLIFNDVRGQAMTLDQMKSGQPTFAALPAVKAGQVAPWFFEQPYSYQRYATVLEDLTKAVESADPAVVP
jgi:iron complex transport system substrate-binding protein